MKPAKRSEKLVWALDPFSKDKGLQMRTYQALADLAPAMNAAIEPVTVINPFQLSVPPRLFVRKQEKCRKSVESLVGEWVKKIKNPDLLPPTILIQNDYSQSQATDELLLYAKETGALLIGMGTHARKNIGRLYMGSFVETAVLKTDVPLLVVNPANGIRKNARNILFPTDLSRASSRALAALIPAAKAMNATVLIYHNFERALSGGTLGSLFKRELEKYARIDRKQRKQAVSDLAFQCKKAGVPTRICLDETSALAPEGILNAAKHPGVDLVAMASSSGRLASAIMGSVARSVIRRAPVPVWVVHVPGKSASNRNARAAARLKLVK